MSVSNDNVFSSNGDSNSIIIKPPFKDALTILEVTINAERLVKKFDNKGWEGFYCKAIYWLGIDRISEIEGRVNDSDFAAKLFTKILNQEVDAAIKKTTAEARLKQLRGDDASK